MYSVVCRYICKDFCFKYVGIVIIVIIIECFIGVIKGIKIIFGF